MADITATVITAIDTLYTGVKDLYTVVKDLKPSDIGDYKKDTERLALSIQLTKEKLYNIDEQQFNNVTEKRACDKIREIVLDAEDLLDRVETLIKKKKLNEENDIVARRTSEKKICFPFSCSCTSYVNKAKDLFNKFTKADDMIPSAIKDIEIMLDDTQKYLKDFGLQKHSHEESTDNRIGRASGSQVNAIEIMGRDGDKREVIELLKASMDKQTTIPVVAIVGMGGMGKTTLAQLVFHDKNWQQERCKFDLCLWVDDSKKMDLKSLLKSILKSISPSDSHWIDTLEATQLKNQLADHDKVKGKTLLLVLDDVENENRLSWRNLTNALIASHINKEGSIVLITTRSKGVASSMGASTYQLEGLSKEDSLQLFESYAFSDQTRDETLVPISKCIVEKCAGVPLAIKVIGALLSEIPGDKWEAMVSDLGNNNEIMTILKISYDDLVSTLKQCFSLCALFPKNYRIPKGILSGIWKANMSKEILSGIWQANIHLKKHEDVCSKTLEILCNRCFLDVSQWKFGDEDIYYKMHDWMHDLAKKVAGEEMLVDFDGMKDGNKLIIDKKVRHLSLLSHARRNNTELTFEFEGRRLRTFIRYSEQPLPFDVEKLVSNCPTIRFLDLQGYSINNLTDSIGKLIHLRYLNLSNTDVQTFDSVNELINLQYLCLRNCGALTHLHSGVCDLTSLDGLDISRCGKLKELPMNVEKLTNLGYLTLKKCKALTHLPSGVGRLTSLKILDICSCEKMEELPREIGMLTNINQLYLKKCKALTQLPSEVGGLTNLEVLDISRCENLRELPNEIQNLTKLKRLYSKELKALTHWPSGVVGLTDLEVLDISSCEKLKELPIEIENLTKLKELYSREWKALTQLPSGVGRLTSLEVLDISCCENLEDLPREVEKLTNLKRLNLKECKALTHLPSEVGGLTSLEELDISYCEKLEEIPREVEKLTKLKQLKLQECKALTHLSSGVGGLTSLEVLDISCCEKLEKLPREFEKLTNLKNLNLKDCKALTHFPSGVGGLTSLEVLHISNCGKMKEIIREVESLPSSRICIIN